ncbi:hypothetical protein TcYC6_0029250 [Trypanosoma cruzi]|nr:hypothetical protein TcYC6_0029250 [Trypanosoma cruzi]
MTYVRSSLDMVLPNYDMAASSWAVATDSAKNEMQKTYATLARMSAGVPSTVDPESALLEANMPPLHVFACARGSPY